MIKSQLFSTLCSPGSSFTVLGRECWRPNLRLDLKKIQHITDRLFLKSYLEDGLSFMRIRRRGTQNSAQVKVKQIRSWAI